MELTRGTQCGSFEPRRFRRSSERGATVFIIMMAMLLLSGLGMWSMQSAALVDQASGFSRLAAQTQYTAEMGATSTTAFLSVPGWASAVYSQGRSAPDTCEATMGAPSGVNRFCKRLLLSDLSSATQKEAAQNVVDLGNSTAPGSFGPYSGTHAAALEGDFSVEITEPEPAIVPGTDLSQPIYFRATVTSVGRMRPTAGAVCSAAENSVAGQISLRAHTILGPI